MQLNSNQIKLFLTELNNKLQNPQPMKTDVKKIFNLLKPVAIILTALIGAWFAGSFFSRTLFLIIAVFALVTRLQSILAGFAAIYAAIFPSSKNDA